MSVSKIQNLRASAQIDQLHRLEDTEEWRELRDLYLIDWPTNCIGFYTLQNYYSWLTATPRDKLDNLVIYTLNGVWRKDGLYLIVDRYQLFFNTLQSPNYDQKRLDRALKLINWTKGYKITAITRKHIDTADALVQRLNYEPRRARLYIYFMPRAKALQLQVDCPSGFELHRLRLEDAPMVNELWDNRNPGSLLFIKLVIKHNISMALSNVETGELIAWCTRCQVGCLGTLKVKSGYLRLGYASLVVKAFAREVAAAGDDVLTMVHEHNEASKALFTKLGFDVLENAFHIKAFPNNKFIDWPEDE